MLKETDFMKSIVFEENPFEDEAPDQVRAFDIHGNEVTLNETEQP